MGENIIKFVIGIGQGVGQAVIISPDRSYVRPMKGGFQVDSANLHNDAKKVGEDLKKKLKQYSHGKS